MYLLVQKIRECGRFLFIFILFIFRLDEACLPSFHTQLSIGLRSILFTRVKHSDTRGLGLNRQIDLIPIHRGTYTHACLLGCLSFRSRIVT